jgi:hypothetical protein
MKVIAMTAAAVVVGIVGAWMAAGYLPVRNIETPKYDVIQQGKGYEIRQYHGYIVAEVTVSGHYRESINKGFGKIAGYIFGDNTTSDSIDMTAPVLHEKEAASAKIAMTAPVLHEKDTVSDTYTVAFVMPKEYTLETLPKPKQSDIRFRTVPPMKCAAIRFRGFAREKTVERKTVRLLEALKNDHVSTSGEPFTAQYHPPWTPPFMRRNEVLIALQ